MISLRACVVPCLTRNSALSAPHSVVCVGTLAEVPALEAALVARDHVRVPLSGTRWTWSPDSQFPPITAVRRTKLWSDEKYSQLRQRLRQPVPSPTVQIGGRYVTVDLHAGTTTTSVTGADEPQTPASNPPSTVSRAQFFLLLLHVFSDSSWGAERAEVVFVQTERCVETTLLREFWFPPLCWTGSYTVHSLQGLWH